MNRAFLQGGFIMTSNFKIFAVMGAIAGAVAFAPAARADHVVGVTVGVSGGGGAVAAGGGGHHSTPMPSPAYTSNYVAPAYSVPVYSQGAYVVPNYQQSYYTAPGTLGLPTYYTPSIYAGAFVPPPIVFNTNFVAPNYYLPGDFYARSSYYVPTSVTPIVTYPAPLTIQSRMTSGGRMNSAGGPPSGLTFTPMNHP